jgi:hypothetical protein
MNLEEFRVKRALVKEEGKASGPSLFGAITHRVHALSIPAIGSAL